MASCVNSIGDFELPLSAFTLLADDVVCLLDRPRFCHLEQIRDERGNGSEGFARL